MRFRWRGRYRKSGAIPLPADRTRFAPPAIQDLEGGIRVVDRAGVGPAVAVPRAPGT
jgi:hypothetical protein